MRKIVLLAVLFVAFDRTSSWAEPSEPPLVQAAVPAPVAPLPIADKPAPAAPEPKAAESPATPPASSTSEPAATSEAAPVSAPAQPGATAAPDPAIKALGAKFRNERVARAEAEGRAAALTQALAEANQKTAGLEQRLEEQNGKLAAALASQQKAMEAEARAAAQNAAIQGALIATNSRMLLMFAISGAAFLLTALALTLVIVWQRRILAQAIEKDEYALAKRSEGQLQKDNSELREQLKRLSADVTPEAEPTKSTLRQQVKALQTQLEESQGELRRLKEERAAQDASKKDDSNPDGVADLPVAKATPAATKGVIKVNPSDRPKGNCTLPGMVPRKGN